MPAVKNRLLDFAYFIHPVIVILVKIKLLITMNSLYKRGLADEMFFCHIIKLFCYFELRRKTIELQPEAADNRRARVVHAQGVKAQELEGSAEKRPQYTVVTQQIVAAPAS